VTRLPVGAGTPGEFPARASAHPLVLAPADGAAPVIPTAATGADAAMPVVSLQPEPRDGSRATSRGFYRCG
jgi:hypothetical protein